MQDRSGASDRSNSGSAVGPLAVAKLSSQQRHFQKAGLGRSTRKFLRQGMLSGTTPRKGPTDGQESQKLIGSADHASVVKEWIMARGLERVPALPTPPEPRNRLR